MTPAQRTIIAAHCDAAALTIAKRIAARPEGVGGIRGRIDAQEAERAIYRDVVRSTLLAVMAAMRAEDDTSEQRIGENER